MNINALDELQQTIVVKQAELRGYQEALALMLQFANALAGDDVPRQLAAPAASAISAAAPRPAARPSRERERPTDDGDMEIAGTQLWFSPTEMQYLKLFIDSEDDGRVRVEALARISGRGMQPAYQALNAINKKLAPTGAKIINERGTGYRFVEPS